METNDLFIDNEQHHIELRTVTFVKKRSFLGGSAGSCYVTASWMLRLGFFIERVDWEDKR